MMPRRLKVTALVDAAVVPSGDPQFEQAEESRITEYHVISTLRELGYKVSVLATGDDIAVVVNTLTQNRPDIVFNLTEQFAGDRRLDKNVAGVLEMLNIPFTGTSANGLMLCRDKLLCKQLLSLHKIRVPGFVSLPVGKKARIPKAIRYPMVIKPAFEDGSEGISNASVVANESALRERAEFVHERWQQAAIAEEYIEGRELYVAILGNKRLTVFPIRECSLASGSDSGPQLATYRVKWNKEYREKHNIEFGFAKLSPETVEAISRTCKKVYRVLQIHDYGRVDLRLTPDGKLVVLEANPNPDLAYGEEIAEAAAKGGVDYETLIARILKLALRRYA
ncbi:MAG: ATP-grasp domain-containing protein [Candidatus Eiseniibacteriota bacterium]|nr:MAG: ATP-grasp domain-containing protein [Candidatus Eisenbacteria bacterium]